MKIGNLINRIKSDYSKGINAESTRLQTKYVYNLLLTSIVDIYSKHLNNNNIIHNYIELKNFPLKTIETNCKYIVKKSVYPIPDYLTSAETDNIDVKSATVRFNKINPKYITHITAGRFASLYKYYYVIDNYIYTVNSKAKKVDIYGLFFNPIQVYEIKKQYDNTISKCMSYRELEFKIPEQILNPAITNVVKELVEVFERGNVDETTNLSEDEKR